jgi:hypothetical protein
MTSIADPLTFRPATGDDHLALTRLAALDSADAVPPGRLLVAEVAGELHAALSLEDGSAIADPFHPTAHILELLRAHAASLEPVHPRRWLGLSERASLRPRLTGG